MKSRMLNRSAAGLVVATFITSTGAYAQEAPQGEVYGDIVVTAQKREERLQDVPVAVGVVSGDEMDRLGISSLEEMSRYTPNLSINDTISGNRIAIRGVESGNNRGFEQSVGLFVDGIYGGRAGQFSVPFFDVERVEVLRGPQSVLFGKNTVAGAVSIITARPSDVFEGEVAVSHEARFGGTEVSGILSGPVTDRFRIRLAARHAESDKGWVYNTFLKRRERTYNSDLARLSFAWEPTDAIAVEGKYEYSTYDLAGNITQLIAFGASGQRLFRQFDPLTEARLDLQSSSGGGRGLSVDDTRAHNGALKVDWEFGGATLTSLTGYSDTKIREWNEDSDLTAVPFLFFDSGERYRQFSQELRFESSIGSSVDYTLGLYFQDARLRTNPAFLLNASLIGLFDTYARRDFRQRAKTYSAFAEASIHLSDSLDVVAGARYAREEKAVHRTHLILNPATGTPETSALRLATLRAAVGWVNFDVTEDRTESQLSPAITLRFRPSADVMAYAKVSRGYKGGGSDVTDQRGTAPQYDNERVTAYEAGLKLQSGDAVLNTALFWSVFDGLQVQTWDGTATFLTTNAGKATSRGVEMDGMWRLSKQLSLIGSAGFTDAKYDRYTDAACTIAQTAAFQTAGGVGTCRQDLSGRPLIHAPRWSASLGAKFEERFANAWGITVDIGANYRSAQYVTGDLDPIGRQGAYATIDTGLRILSPTERLTLGVSARNLLDRRAMTWVSNVAIIGGGAKGASIIEPRTVTLSAKYRF